MRCCEYGPGNLFEILNMCALSVCSSSLLLINDPAKRGKERKDAAIKYDFYGCHDIQENDIQNKWHGRTEQHVFDTNAGKQLS